MSSGTNQERITQNNAKLAELKTKADNLPEYQDIEPIYSSASFNTKTTGLNFSYSYSAYWELRSKLDKYVYYMRSMANPYYHYLGKINDDGTITRLWYNRLESGGFDPSWMLLDYDDNYLYILYWPSNASSDICHIRRFDLFTNTMEASDYWTITMPVSYFGSYYRILKRGVFCFIGYIYKVDCKNKIATLVKRVYTYDTRPSIMYNSQIGAASTTTSGNIIWTLFNYDSGTSYTYDAIKYDSDYSPACTNINAIISSNKIVINNNLYELTDSLAKGDLIKENVIEDYSAHIVLIEIAPNYFIESVNYVKKSASTQIRKVYHFDEDTFMFTKVAVVSNTNSSTPGIEASLHYLSAMMYIDSNYLWQINVQPDTSEIIGYIINGNTMMLPTNVISDSDKIVNGEAFYNKFGIEVFGTMPNNGQLNYTPTTSQQTIPAGYTSGGIVEATTSNVDSNIIPTNIKKGVEILGVLGTLDGSGLPQPEIYMGAEVETSNSDTRTLSVNAVIGSYCYAIIYHRTPIQTFTNGWTKFAEYAQTDGTNSDNIIIFYKKATETTETFTITTSDSNKRLGGVLLSTRYNYFLPNIVYNQSPANQNTNLNVMSQDIVICSSYTIATGYYEDNWSVDFTNTSYPCRETNNNNYSRFNVFIPKETKNAHIASYYESACSRIIVLRLPNNMGEENLVPENIKEGVTIFGVTGTYTGPDVSL